MNDSRTRILDAAEELFAETGYEATSTARIAELASVPKGLVFHYFPQKMDVLLTLVDERTRIEVLPDEPHPGDPAGALRRLASRIPLRASPSMRRILFREAETHKSVRERLGAVNRELVGHARRGLELALPGARGDAARLEIAAATFATVLLYQESLFQLTGDRVDPDALADLISRALS
ncbi:helix-turn-helix domain-containing protein [Actinocorallia longicatena]|uniref:HTH tetR-type domain-containing protein n=1 Tax=Actinocorallia longicatena TaxID=111803 RepID=A0ABP6QIY3_9ACTN